MWGKSIFYYIYSASYVIYRHWGECVLFILGVMNLHPTSSGAWFATTAFECSIYIHFLSLPARLTSLTFSSSTVFSLIFHVDKLALSQFFTNDRGVAPKWSLSTFCFVCKVCEYIQWQYSIFPHTYFKVKVYNHLKYCTINQNGRFIS